MSKTQEKLQRIKLETDIGLTTAGEGKFLHGHGIGIEVKRNVMGGPFLIVGPVYGWRATQDLADYIEAIDKINEDNGRKR